jgi:hypothetical protein
MKKIISLVLSTAMAISVFGAVSASEVVITSEKSAIISALNSDIKTDNTATSKSTSEDITSNDLKKEFKSQLSTLIKNLESLREQCKTLWNDISTQNEQIKKTVDQIKPNVKDPKIVKEAYKKIFDEIKPFREQVISQHNDIKAQRLLKDAQWVIYRNAVKSKDVNAAKAAMTSIISLKSLIIADQQKILAAKSSILGILKTYVAPTVIVTPKPTIKPKPTPRSKPSPKVISLPKTETKNNVNSPVASTPTPSIVP